MKKQYNDNVTIILREGDKVKLIDKLKEMNIPFSHGLREILTAFIEGRCAITPPPPKTHNELDNLYNQQ